VVSAAASWASYRASIGDRSGLFAALVSGWDVQRALYPGCYLDLAPSVAIRDVTYVDVDRRAAKYFADPQRVRAELAGRAGAEVAFLAADYTLPLPLPPAAFDLLISLYAGPVWEHCRRHLRPGGLLLANASHGDACIAALDPDLRLLAAVHLRAGHYRLDTENLGRYLVPKNPAAVDPEAVRRSGRGIAYTRTAFAYLFALR
jgi:SAM-dependent methyltransferase